MGKSKSKKSQPKRYPTPTDKYLIVTDPWGGVPMQEPNFFNNVTAWFEIMLKPKYPGVRPSAIFYQWTNKNIIVEIPDHIDVEPYLGAHYWSSFLVPPYCYQVGLRASYIYEYETRFFPTPAGQGGWTPGYAQYTKIRDNFDVREPYPEPLRARNSPLLFAKKLPPGKVTELDQPPPLPLEIPLGDVDDQSAGSPTRGRSETADTQISGLRRREDTDPLDTPYQAPDRLAADTAESSSPASRSMPPPPLLSAPNTSEKLKKMDPYEEEEIAMALLRRSTTATASDLGRNVPVTTVLEVKKEQLPPVIKDQSYTPSRELQRAFNSLQQTPLGDDLPHFDDEEEDEIKPKVEMDNQMYRPSGEWAQAFASLHQSDSGTYVPSEGLLEAIASLPDGLVDMASGFPDVGVKIKPEPGDDGILLSPLGQRERSMTLASESAHSTQSRVGIKREPSEEYESVKRIKVEH